MQHDANTLVLTILMLECASCASTPPRPEAEVGMSLRRKERKQATNSFWLLLLLRKSCQTCCRLLVPATCVHVQRRTILSSRVQPSCWRANVVFHIKRWNIVATKRLHLRAYQLFPDEYPRSLPGSPQNNCRVPVTAHLTRGWGLPTGGCQVYHMRYFTQPLVQIIIGLAVAEVVDQNNA